MRPRGGNPVDEILPILADPDAPPILSRADTVIEKYRHPVTYFKSALGLILLREQILGPERFDPAFRRFIAAWAFKHPKPADFFRAMESESGRGLELVVARLVRQQLAARPRRHRHQAVPATSGGLPGHRRSRDKLVMPGDAARDFRQRHAPRLPPARRKLDPPGGDRRAGGRRVAGRPAELIRTTRCRIMTARTTCSPCAEGPPTHGKLSSQERVGDEFRDVRGKRAGIRRYADQHARMARQGREPRRTKRR